MPAQIRVRCPRCAGEMLVDPHFLTTQTACIYCAIDFLPASCVVPDLPVAPSAPPVPPKPKAASQPPDFDFEEDAPPRSSSRQHEHRVKGALSTGFLAGLGGGCGCVFGVIIAIALIIAGIMYAIQNSRENSHPSRRSGHSFTPELYAFGSGGSTGGKMENSPGSGQGNEDAPEEPGRFCH